jgi:uroporphyrinogen decarboxylase
MKRNMKNWIYNICNSTDRSAMPVITYPGTQLTGSNIIDMVKDGQTQYECIKALCEKYPVAAAQTAMDLSVEAEAFGSPVKFSDREAPNITSAIVHDMDSINALQVPAVGAGRTGEYLKAAYLASKEINDRLCSEGLLAHSHWPEGSLT